MISTNPRKDFDLSAGTNFCSKSRRGSSARKTNGSLIDRKAVLVNNGSNPSKVDNFISEPRTIRHICEDATFAAETAAIELDLYLSWMRRLPVSGAAMVGVEAAPVVKAYKPDFGDRDEVLRQIKERDGIPTDEELVFLIETSDWVLGEMSPRLQATKDRMERVGG